MTPHDAFSLLSTLHARESVHIEKRVTIRHASLLTSSDCAPGRPSVPLDLDERANRSGVSCALSVVRRCTRLFVAVRCHLRPREREGPRSLHLVGLRPPGRKFCSSPKWISERAKYPTAKAYRRFESPSL